MITAAVMGAAAIGADRVPSRFIASPLSHCGSVGVKQERG
jgi:hypothetical protein